jgi:tetratricopeptide (TPR) repeat protein
VRTRYFFFVWIALAVAQWTGLSLQAPGAESESEKPAAAKGPHFGLLLLDEAPQPLGADAASEEARRDKVEAIALYSAARALEYREDYGKALRLYQRALRYDPQAVEIARAIVPLAVQLKREGVAVRYALIAAELEEDIDPILLRRLAARLDEEGDLPQALKLYQRALAMRANDNSPSSEDILLRMETGRLLCLTGRYPEAADCFAAVVEALDDPEKYGLSEELTKALLDEPSLTYTLFGDCFLQAGRLEQAQAAYEQARRLEPNEELWQFQLAQVLDKKGKPAEALQALQAALERRLSTVGIRPYELLEKVLADMGKKDELIPRLEKFHAADPQNVPLGYYLAGKYLEAGSLEKAEPLYAALVEKTPTLTGFKSLAEIYRKTKRFDALLTVLGQTVEKTGVLDTLGSEEFLLSKDTEVMQGLIETARKELQDDPENYSFGKRFALGLLALDGKQWETAAEFLPSAIAAGPKQAAEVYLVWGIGLLADNRAAQAAKVFQEGIDRKVLPENNPIFYFYLAGALAMEDRIDEALAAARKAAEMRKDAVRFRSRIGWVYFHGKRYDEAEREYRKLLDDFDEDYENEENRKALREVRFALSNLCVLQQKSAAAQEWLEQVLDEFPNDIGAMNDLGYLWADENRHLQRALKMIRKAVEAEPANAAYRDSLGWALFRLGRNEEALAELEKAAEKQSDAVIIEHLGDVYQQLDKPQKAREAWQRAAELFRKDKEEEKAKEIEKKLQNIENIK